MLEPRTTISGHPGILLGTHLERPSRRGVEETLRGESVPWSRILWQEPCRRLLGGNFEQRWG